MASVWAEVDRGLCFHGVGLVDREVQLEALRSWLGEAARGEGRLVFVGGEAGAGKSSLVAKLCGSLAPEVDVFWGACEPLSVPRPLGPVADMASRLGGGISEMMQRGDRNGVFAETLEALAGGSGVRVMVIEDAHWADESTFDLLQFLVRRIARLRVLILVTFRVERPEPLDPMSVLLGDTAPMPVVRRLTVPPLSPAGVRELAAGSGLDADKLHRDTGGNAFFVTEILRQGSHVMPQSVADAVLARFVRLRPPVRWALEAAAVIGSRVDPGIALAIADVGAAELDESVRAGFLISEGRYLSFRHDLVRQAVLESIPPRRRAQLHSEVLQKMLASPVEEGQLSLLAEHAEEAGDVAAVLEFAPVAALAAARLGAHREAAFQYARALRFADGLGASQRAELLERRANECQLVDQREVAIEAWQEAIGLWEDLGETLRAGDDWHQLAHVLRDSGRRRQSEQCAARAVEILEPLGPGPELAMAYAQQCGLSMTAGDGPATMSWGHKALGMAEQFGNTMAQARALNSIGVVLARSGDPAGEGMMQQSLEISIEAGFEGRAASGYNNLAIIAFERLDLATATDRYEAGLAYCAEHDLYSESLHIQAGWAEAHFYAGRWDEAVELCRPVIESSHLTKAQAMAYSGRIRARRRDPDVWPLLDEAKELAAQADELQVCGLVAAARAEALWLSGKADRVAGEVRAAFDLAVSLRSAWSMGELGWWLWRVGELTSAPPGALRPFALQIDGDWQQAAAEWADHGFDYEAAMALADSSLESDLRAAVATFDRLGAVAAREFAIQRLRRLGGSAIPRGPRRSTRHNPARLTSRELEVLNMVERGLTDPEIASAMFLSTRTVNHHVSAILAKLEVTSRAQAAERARQLMAG